MAVRNEAWEDLLLSAARGLGVVSATVHTLKGEHLEPVYTYSPRTRRRTGLTLRNGVAGQVMRSGAPVLLRGEDIKRVYVGDARSISTLLVYPVHWKGNVVGTVSLIGDRTMDVNQVTEWLKSMEEIIARQILQDRVKNPLSFIQPAVVRGLAIVALLYIAIEVLTRLL